MSGNARIAICAFPRIRAFPRSWGTKTARNGEMRSQRASVLVFAVLMAACAQLPLPESPGTVGVPRTSLSVAAEVVELTNRERVRQGLRALSTSAELTQAARLHAEQMASHRELAHTIEGARYPTMESRL